MFQGHTLWASVLIVGAAPQYFFSASQGLARSSKPPNYTIAGLTLRLPKTPRLVFHGRVRGPIPGGPAWSERRQSCLRELLRVHEFRVRPQRTKGPCLMRRSSGRREMKKNPRLAVWPLLLVAAFLFATMRAGGSEPAKSEAHTADCSFSNPNIPGWCNVTIPVPRHSTPQQACDAVLRCMNSSACPDHQKYCVNPGTARDWKLEEAKASLPRVDCAYSNSGFSGWCRRTSPVPRGMTPRQACEAIVPCLNGAPCQGFSQYCDPEIRTGWRLAEVNPSAPPPTPRR
jgi:hypothetical protein